jgi:hypothetical protein
VKDVVVAVDTSMFVACQQIFGKMAAWNFSRKALLTGVGMSLDSSLSEVIGYGLDVRCSIPASRILEPIEC